MGWNQDPRVGVELYAPPVRGCHLERPHRFLEGSEPIARALDLRRAQSLNIESAREIIRSALRSVRLFPREGGGVERDRVGSAE